MNYNELIKEVLNDTPKWRWIKRRRLKRLLEDEPKRRTPYPTDKFGKLEGVLCIILTVIITIFIILIKGA